MSEQTGLDYLAENLPELRRQYDQQWVAIEDGQVRAAAPTMRGLMDAIERAGLQNPFVTFICEAEWEDYVYQQSCGGEVKGGL